MLIRKIGIQLMDSVSTVSALASVSWVRLTGSAAATIDRAWGVCVEASVSLSRSLLFGGVVDGFHYVMVRIDEPGTTR